MKGSLLAVAATLAQLCVGPAVGCEPYAESVYNNPSIGIAYMTAGCGFGNTLAYINFQLSYDAGVLTLAFSTSGATTQCYLGYETNRDGENWGYQAVGSQPYIYGPVGEGWIYYGICDDADGTQFFVSAGQAEGGYVEPARLD